MNRGDLEQIEIIDIEPEEVIRDRWSEFIHTHHYDYRTDYFESTLANFPRRSGESFFKEFLPSTIEEAMKGPRPVPRDFSTIEQMWDWFLPLIEAEKEKLRD